MSRAPGLRAALGITAVLAACSTTPDAVAAPPTAWHELFDGRSLGAFAITDFGGQGEVAVADGRLQLGIGSPLTGVTWTAAAPHGDYEVEVVAARVQGNDFFCGLTFPVGDAHLTLVLGGWGGAVCGFSSLDGEDAAHNATRTLRTFAAGRDHRILVQVRTDGVAASIDGEPLCAVDPRAHRLGLRPEVTLSRPLGLATFATAASIAQVRWRPLAPMAPMPAR